MKYFVFVKLLYGNHGGTLVVGSLAVGKQALLLYAQMLTGAFVSLHLFGMLLYHVTGSSISIKLLTDCE